MIEISSTPMIIVGILGTIGILLPIINIARKEQGSTSFYGAIAIGALLVSIGYVVYQVLSDNVAEAAIFTEDVLADDAFGSLFAIAMLIVAIMTTVGSLNYMKTQKHPAVYFSLILLSSIGMVLVAYSTAFETAARLGGIIGGGTEEQILSLAEYGKNIGIAYQIRDDLLDWKNEDKLFNLLIKKSTDPRNVFDHMEELLKKYTSLANNALRKINDCNEKGLLENLVKFTMSRA